jgi:hypothetical protein
MHDLHNFLNTYIANELELKYYLKKDMRNKFNQYTYLIIKMKDGESQKINQKNSHYHTHTHLNINFLTVLRLMSKKKKDY